MTYIEFFDKVPTENIVACLTYAPDRVILIGDSSKLMDAHIKRYERIFKDRGKTIEFLRETVAQNALDKAVAKLSEIVETYIVKEQDTCVFDVTGGNELLLVALGIVCARYPEQNIQIHRFNLRNNIISDCDKDGVTIYRDAPMLTVEENIRLYGGDVVYGTICEEDKTYRWDMNETFERDLRHMWEISKRGFGKWNSEIGVLKMIVCKGSASADGLTVTADIDAVDWELRQNKHTLTYATLDTDTNGKCDTILRSLKRYGLITRFEETADKKVTVSFKDKQVKACFTNEGQVLELMVYLTAKTVKGKDGNEVYNSSLTGVQIDWDGDPHGTLYEQLENVSNHPGNSIPDVVYDTENEIDVLLMHKTVPVFVSCKNGDVKSEELYKLRTVAEQFGGPYAKAVLVATSIPVLVKRDKNDRGHAGEYLRQRAKDMGIRLIENFDPDSKETERVMSTLWEG